MKGHRIKKYLGFLVMALALILVAGQVKAGYIDDRSVLDALLVGASHEDFEGLSISDGDAGPLASPYISASGTRFLVGPDNDANDGNVPELQQNGQGYYGQPSKDIVSLYSKSLVIDFTGVSNPETEQGVCAFGLDLLAFEGNFFADYSDNATVKVYGNDDSLLYETLIPVYLSDDYPITPDFFGFSDDDGIGIKEVVITGNNPYDWSPIIDNVTFGTQVVPIPSAVWLLGAGLLGLLGLRRKFK